MIGALPAGIVQGLFPQGQMQTAAEPFVWGQGGRRMTPQDIAREREIAASLTQLDFSPVDSPWQGLARVAGNVSGALRERKADKASNANADYSQQIMQSLVNPSGSPSASAPPGAASSTAPGGNLPQLMQVIADPYVDRGTKEIAQMQLEQAQRMAMKQFEIDNRAPLAPHYWETNNGSLGMIGPDGKPQIVYEDKTPKIQWMTVDNGDGTKSVIPYGPNGPLGQSGGAPQAEPQRPKGKLTPYTGGQTPAASGNFR